jgi:cytochrome P450
MAVVVSPQPIPGPTPIPLVGRQLSFFQFLRSPVAYQMQVYRVYGQLAGRTAGDTRHILAVGPEYNRLVLSDTARFHTIFETITPERVKKRRRGIGLLNMNGERHRQQRRLMLPAFHRKQVESYRDTMERFTAEVLDTWRPGQELDVVQQMSQLTLRIACQTLFGIDVADRAQVIGSLVKQFLDSNLFAPQVLLFPFDIPGTPFHRMMQTNERLEDEVLALIARKRAGGGEHQDVLAMLMAARDEDGTAMTDDELLGQTFTLLLAGHETSSNALTWTLFLLAQHPRIYADLVDEVTGVLQGGAPTLEHLRPERPALPLLERVIRESMRLLPPAALLSRIGTEPFAIGPYECGRGTVVTLSQYATHRMPELYPAPQRFNPARWEGFDPSPYEYLPFGAGSRMCIGATFAMMEIKLVLAMLLQRYRLAIRPGARVDYQVKVTLSPRGGMPMAVHAQDRRFTKTPVRGNIHTAVDLV